MNQHNNMEMMSWENIKVIIGSYITLPLLGRGLMIETIHKPSNMSCLLGIGHLCSRASQRMVILYYSHWGQGSTYPGGTLRLH